MRKCLIKRFFSVAMVLTLVLSMSSVAFAASDTETATKNGYTLTGFVDYWGKDPSDGAAGEVYISASWSGNNVRGIYASGEVVDYLTGASLKTLSNNKANATSVYAETFHNVPYTQRVTVYGCAEIRDSFSLVAYPTIYGTYGNA